MAYFTEQYISCQGDVFGLTTKSQNGSKKILPKIKRGCFKLIHGVGRLDKMSWIVLWQYIEPPPEIQKTCMQQCRVIVLRLKVNKCLVFVASRHNSKPEHNHAKHYRLGGLSR